MSSYYETFKSLIKMHNKYWGFSVSVVQTRLEKKVFYRVKETLQHGTKIAVKFNKETMACRRNNIFIKCTVLLLLVAV